MQAPPTTRVFRSPSSFSTQPDLLTRPLASSARDRFSQMLSSSRSTHFATRVSSSPSFFSPSEKCAPSVQQPTSGDSA